MIKYAWAGPEDARNCTDVLLDLEKSGVAVADCMFLFWGDYHVVAYVEKFPADFNEATERERFFKDILTPITIGV